MPTVDRATRHVWIRGFGERQPAVQGLVLAWRKVPAKGPTSPAYSWQAQVVAVDERDESFRIQWFYASDLVPVAAAPPA